MNKNFDYLGNTFQIQLLNQIVVDKDFSSSIMDVIEANYFDSKYFKIILQMIKEYYVKYESTPNFDTLEQIVNRQAMVFHQSLYQRHYWHHLRHRFQSHQKEKRQHLVPRYRQFSI